MRIGLLIQKTKTRGNYDDFLIYLTSEIYSLIIEQFLNFERKNEIIIDLLSVERNFVLVRSNVLGGPNETRIPNRLSPRDVTYLFSI